MLNKFPLLRQPFDKFYSDKFNLRALMNVFIPVKDTHTKCTVPELRFLTFLCLQHIARILTLI